MHNDAHKKRVRGRRILKLTDLRELGIPYSDRQLRRLESQGLWPRRIQLEPGCKALGWFEDQIERRLAEAGGEAMKAG